MTRVAARKDLAAHEAPDACAADDLLRFHLCGGAFVAMDERHWLELESESDRRQLRARACGTLRIGGRLHIIFSDDDLPGPGEAPLATVLTRRELEIAQEIARGAGNKEIARLLGISHLTVREHIRRVCSKLGVHSRAAIAGRIGAKADLEWLLPHNGRSRGPE